MSAHSKSTIRTSKHDCFVTLYASFVDIGYETFTETYSRCGIKFKYSDMVYTSVCRSCICIQVIKMFNEFCNSGREVRSFDVFKDRIPNARSECS